MGQAYKYKHDVVMVIDDSALDNLVARLAIETAGFASKTYIHTSAQSALEFLVNLGKTNNFISSAFPDVIFVDLHMPGMDGIQFLSYYRSFVEIYSIRCRMIVLTSSARIEDRKKVQEIDPTITYLRKPLTVEMLSVL